MTLIEEIHPLVGEQKKFLLFRILGESAETARCLVDVTRGVYNHWFDDPVFVRINRKRDELAKTYRNEAYIELRRANRIAAILLEEAMLKEMKAEIEQKDYNLVKTPLAREVYAKLMENNEESTTPQGGWAGRLQQIFVNNQPPRAEVVGVGDVRQLQADNSQTEQHTEGELVTPSEQELSEGEEGLQP